MLAPDLPADTLQAVIVLPWGQAFNACAPKLLSTHASSGSLQSCTHKHNQAGSIVLLSLVLPLADEASKFVFTALMFSHLSAAELCSHRS